MQSPKPVGTAVLQVLVERHQQFLESRGTPVSSEEALGRLLACFCRWNREKVLATVAAALKEIGCNGEDLQQLLTSESNGTTT